MDHGVAEMMRLAAETPAETDDLYHYTSASVAVDSILTQAQLRLGLIEATNDPRESRPRYPPISLAHGVANDDVQEIWAEADRLLRRSAKVACFTRDYALPDWALEGQRLRGYAHSALWAHYGEAHRGVCLKFRRATLGSRIRDSVGDRGLLFEGPVRYSSESWSGSANAENLDLEQINEFGLDAVVTRFIEQHHQELFFRKHDDWSNEHEYRWLLVEAGLVPLYIDITGCLTGIVLGDAFPEARLRAVHHLADSCGGIDVAQVKFHNGGPMLIPLARPTPSSRPHRRTGTALERTKALRDAEADAAAAKARAEEFVRPLVSRLQTIIDRVRVELAECPAARVQTMSGFAAIPQIDRRRRPGVPTFESEYDVGVMCVVTDDSRPIEVVAGVALQSLNKDRLRFHGAITLRDLSSTDGETELWRFREESERDMEVARGVLDDMGGLVLGQLAPALASFDALRQHSVA